MGASMKYLQDLSQVQMQQTSDKITKYQNPKLQLNFN